MGRGRHHHHRQHRRLLHLHPLTPCPASKPNVSPVINNIPLNYLTTKCRIVTINKYWDKSTKFIILFIDASLNFYFLRTVNERLVRNSGLTKYRPLASFNAKLMAVSVLMDVSTAISFARYSCSSSLIMHPNTDTGHR